MNCIYCNTQTIEICFSEKLVVEIEVIQEERVCLDGSVQLLRFDY